MRASLLLAVAVAGACSSKDNPKATPTSATPATAPAQITDQGKFTLTGNGEPIGEETFSISLENGHQVVRTKASIRGPGGDSALDGTLEVDSNWRPLGGKFHRKAGARDLDSTLTRDGATLSLDGRKEDKASDVFLMAGAVSHLAAMCALAADDGDKDLSLFPGVRFLLHAKKKVPFEGQDGKKVDLDLVEGLLNGDNQMEALCLGPKLILVRQPAVEFVATRVGYEELGAKVVKRPPPKPPLPDDLVELPRTVKGPSHGADGEADLACTLLLPRDATAKLPAVVFISGTGPEDRDEDTAGPGGIKLAIFKRLAIVLGKAGIASLRCDDRGVGHSTGSQATATIETFADDAKAEIATLRGEPAIDPAHLGVIGHSEGGLIAPMVAVDDPRVTAIVLLAGLGRRLDVVSLDQKEAALRAQGAPPDEIKKELTHARQIYDAIRDGKPLPADTPDSEKKLLQPMIPWLASHFRHDPLATAAKVKAAVLIAQGGKDFQVAPTDADLLLAAFTKGGNKRVTLKRYPELSHVFAAVKLGTSGDYVDAELLPNEGFMNDVAEFLKKNL